MLIRCAVGHIPSIRKMGEITTPIATIIARNTMRNVFILCFSILHSSCFSGFLPPKLRNEFPEKSDSYPFFGRSSITSSHSENTDSHRYVNSFCPAAGRSPSGLLCQHEKMYRHFPLCSWILCSFYIYKKVHPPANARRCTCILVASLRWHDPNQVRSKIYLPLSLSHRLPRFYCSYIVGKHSTDLIFCQQRTFRMTLPVYSNVDFTTVHLSPLSFRAARMPQHWQLPHSGNPHHET